METASGWRTGYQIAFVIQMVIAVTLFLTLPLWKKHGESREDNDEQVLVLSLSEILHTPGIKIVWLLFIATCAIECTCGSWGGTYLVEMHGMSPDAAAKIILFYYTGVAVGRFIAGVFSKWLKVYTIILIGICVIITGCILLFVSVGTVPIILGLMMIGIGNGPMFPNFNYMTPLLYGEEKSPALIGTEYTSASISTMTVPIIVGQIAEKLGFVIFSYVIAMSTIILIVAYFFLYKKIIINN